MSNSVPNPAFHKVTFTGSFPTVEKTPFSDLPEFAFMGRSNVGKSSLINYLCGRKDIAKTSSTPGKTQMINLFNVEDEWMIADLPGYGYARVSKKKRSKWSHMIEQYLRKREQLVTAFLLIDLRVDPMEQDIERIRWLGEYRVPFSIIFTKADKLKPKETEDQVAIYTELIQKDFSDMPNYFITSSSKKMGADEVVDYIRFVLDSFE